MSVTVTLSADEKTVRITGGDKIGIAVFYCQWQTRLWADWRKQSILKMQHERVVHDIRMGEPVLISYGVEIVQCAVLDAIDICKDMGIDVRWGFSESAVVSP